MPPHAIVSQLIPATPALVPLTDAQSQPITIDGTCTPAFSIVLEYDPARAPAGSTGAGAVVVLYGVSAPGQGQSARCPLAIAYVRPGDFPTVPAILAAYLGFPRYAISVSTQGAPLRATIVPLPISTPPMLRVDERCRNAPVGGNAVFAAPVGLPTVDSLGASFGANSPFVRRYLSSDATNPSDGTVRTPGRDTGVAIKTSPGRLYGHTVHLSATAPIKQYLLFFDRTTAPDAPGALPKRPPVRLDPDQLVSISVEDENDSTSFDVGIYATMSMAETYSAPTGGNLAMGFFDIRWG